VHDESLDRVPPALRVVLIALAAIALFSGAASAQTGAVALRWDNCYSDGGLSSKSFACNTNSGSESLILSVYPPVDMPQLNGALETLTVWSTAAATPTWWQVNSGGCRPTSGMSAQFLPLPSSITCIDPWTGQASGGFNFEPTYFAPNIARLRVVGAIAGTVSIPANQEVFLARVVIFNTKTVGTGSCAGCLTPACIGFNSVQLTQPVGVGDYVVMLPLAGTHSDYVGWQMDATMGETITSPFGVPQKSFVSCQSSATPSRRPTWGAVKSLYR